MSDIDVTECPDCGEKGRYEGRVLIGGRGFYTCPSGHRWQNANEKPTDKGAPVHSDEGGHDVTNTDRDAQRGVVSE